MTNMNILPMLPTAFDRCASAAVPLLLLANVLVPAAGQCSSTWTAFAPGMDATVYAATALANGNLVVGGNFTTAQGVAASRIAQWTGAGFVPLGAGVSGTPAGSPTSVRTMLTLPNGDLLVGGVFDTAGGVPALNLARWNGSTWSSFGGGLAGYPFALARMANGDIVAAIGGGPWMPGQVFRWDGTSWSSFGSGLDDYADTLAVLPSGDLVVGGRFTTAGGVSAEAVARWDGTAWSALGSGLSGSAYGTTQVQALLVLPNGDLIVGGDFTSAGGSPAGGIARWDGTAWWPLGSGVNGQVRALALLPNGDIVAGGVFNVAGGVAANYVARWDGVSWSAIGAGTNNAVQVATMAPLGDLLVGGQFTAADGQSSLRVARIGSSCMAVANSSGTGCPSSGGSNTLAAATLPWVGSTFRATGTGLPGFAIVLALTGLTPIAPGALPLASIFAQGVAGCDVLVQPDILDVLIAMSGTASSALYLPNTPALIGATFYHQMVPIEVDAGLNFLAITATNALQLTAGMF